MAETLAVASCEKIFNENFFSGLQSSHSISTESSSSEDSSHSSKPEDSSTSSSSSSTHTHRYTEEVTTPTCTEQGYTTYTCACGDSYIDNYLPATHTEVIDEAVAPPSCTKTGLTEGKHCSVCSTILVAQETVNATGHSYVNSICDVCGEIKTSQGLRYSLNDDGVSYSLYNIGTCTDTDIVIPSKYEGLPVTNIYPYAFQNQAITSVIIPDSVTSIGYNAFNNCANLTSVVISDSVTSIGMQAFMDCTSLTSLVIGNHVTSIDVNAFYFCNNLTSITIDKNNANYKDIDVNLYTKDGTVLIQYAIGKTETSFTLPDSVTSISDSAFAYCYNLTSVVIPNSVTSIDDNAFYFCRNLTSVYYKGSAEDWMNISIDNNNENNQYFINTTRYYYSETKPTAEGNYWYYNENGEIAVWENSNSTEE